MRPLFMLLIVVLSSLTFLTPAHAGELHSSTMTIELQSEVFARRGDGVVTQADMDVFLHRLPRHHRPEYLADPERIGEALERLMLPRQIAARARAEGFMDSPERQNQMLQLLTVFLADEYMESSWQEVRLDDYSQQARELYLTRKDLLRLPRKVDFTHILIRSGTERGDLAAMRSILAIYDELQEGAELSELAEQYSEDPSVSENGGRFEGVDLASLDEAVRQIAQVLQPGQISEPFRSSFGWHVLELHDRYRPEIESYGQVEKRALELAESRHRDQWRERFMSSLGTQDVEFAPGAVAQLLDRYQPSDEDIDALSRDVRRRMGLE